jgi:hypothetical protein
MEPPTRNTAK